VCTLHVSTNIFPRVATHDTIGGTTHNHRTNVATHNTIGGTTHHYRTHAATHNTIEGTTHHHRTHAATHNTIPLLPSSYSGRLASRSSTFHFWHDYSSTTSLTTPSRLLTMSFYNTTARTIQKTQPLLSRRRVYWSVT
jgi:hypothetical protein